MTTYTCPTLQRTVRDVLDLAVARHARAIAFGEVTCLEVEADVLDGEPPLSPAWPLTIGSKRYHVDLVLEEATRHRCRPESGQSDEWSVRVVYELVVRAEDTMKPETLATHGFRRTDDDTMPATQIPPNEIRRRRDSDGRKVMHYLEKR